MTRLMRGHPGNRVGTRLSGIHDFLDSCFYRNDEREGKFQNV